MAVLLVIFGVFLQVIFDNFMPSPAMYAGLFPFIIFGAVAYGGKWSGRISVLVYFVLWPATLVLSGKEIVSLIPSGHMIQMMFIEAVMFVEVAGGWRSNSLLKDKKAKLLADSERNLRYVINHISDYVMILTRSGIVIEANEALLENTSVKAEDILGRFLGDTPWWLGNISERKKINEAIVKAVNGSPVRYDAKTRTGLDEERITDITLIPVRDEFGVRYIILSAVDVTDRVKTLEENRMLTAALEDEKNRIEELINSIPGAVWEARLSRESELVNIRFLSDYVKTLTGYLPAELNSTGKWLKTVHQKDRLRIRRAIKEIAQKGKNGAIQYRMITKRGRPIWVETRTAILKDSNQDTKILGVVVDISDRKKLEKRKDEFVGMASHELKTPLATVKAFTQILKKKMSQAADTQALRYVDKMEEYLNRLSSIVSDFLDLSKIQTGKMDYQMEPLEVDKLVKEVVEDMRRLTASHKILIRGKTEAVIRGDKNRIAQVLINLINNAIKYSPEAKRVIVKTETTRDWVVIKVKDFGMGIEKDQQERIFERFYRVESGPGRAEGFGVGLFIAAEIVKRHKGEMGVYSQPGKGAEFSFKLPVSRNN